MSSVLFCLLLLASILFASGKLEKKSGVIHVVVGRLEYLSQRLNQLNIKSRDFR